MKQKTKNKGKLQNISYIRCSIPYTPVHVKQLVNNYVLSYGALFVTIHCGIKPVRRGRSSNKASHWKVTSDFVAREIDFDTFGINTTELY